MRRRNMYRRRRPLRRVRRSELPKCAYCGNPMAGRKRKYCDPECRDKAAQARPWIPTSRQSLCIAMYCSGMTLAEVGDATGVSRQAVSLYLKKAGIKARYGRGHKKPPNTCVDCGTEISRKSTRCHPCHGLLLRVDDKRLEIERRWLAGESLKQIAEEMGYASVNSLYQMVVRMRKQGYNMPLRNPWGGNKRGVWEL